MLPNIKYFCRVHFFFHCFIKNAIINYIREDDLMNEKKLVLDEDMDGEVLKDNLNIEDMFEEDIKETSFMDKHLEENENNRNYFIKMQIKDFIQ